MKQHKLFYASSYDRGLDVLLEMWPEIKNKYPDATLDIAYGWDLFDKVLHNNPERQQWKEKVIDLMDQVDIVHHGRLGKKELEAARKQCGILAYPSYFTEINCITVLEAMKDGLVPVTTDLAALKETNDCGVLVEGEIDDPEVKKKYLDTLLDIMGDEKKYKEIQSKCLQKSKKRSWNKIASQWEDIFNTYREFTPPVSIVTPTIRQGWWNLMAYNLSKQTYKNFEWIIVDDYKEDRSSVAAEYAKKYDIAIKYVRGKERKIKRTYGLCNANNTGLQEAKGDLMVIIQDFIIIPEDGIEQLVDIYRRNPNALIAPTDHMYYPDRKPDITKEDWFDGATEVRGELVWQNIRNQYLGMRESNNPYEFEQNYCAIPIKVAKALGGWWEFYDEGLGFDNTSIAYRALQSGYKLIVDDTNVCYGIDHWKPLKGIDDTLSIGRHRNLSDPRFAFEMSMLGSGKLPLKRDESLDSQIVLKYDMPEEVTDEMVKDWIRENAEKIALSWLAEYANLQK
jgi:glycosyltransferase involved in cell wall biosynthesis